MEKLEWSALEYEEKERSRDWFWALGIIVVTGALASAIFDNYFFATLLILSGSLLAFFAIKKPEIISYELNKKGVGIGNRLYPFENIKSFWVQNTSLEEELQPMLFIKTERAFMPIISIPISEANTSQIRDFLMAKNITEEKMREHVSEKVMEFLGF